ncbi:delta-60 repeat domain-containing protein [Cellulomonas sp. NPDC089187]|uniref:delta-60 repeat domain-containing protein n=1 Tax=Cellulomonas sp. NPDC089187 TaxID=3154970 RepID=UPI00343D45B4
MADNGAIYTVGAFTAPGRYFARFAADGTPDAAFNQNVGAALNGPANSIWIDEHSGAITVGGEFTTPSAHLARFHADGTPDTAFNEAIGDAFDGAIYGIAEDVNGGLVVAGMFTTPTDSAMKLSQDGTLDEEFAEAVRGQMPVAYFVDVTPETGELTFAQSQNPPLYRMSADGAPDTAFNAAVQATGIRTAWEFYRDPDTKAWPSRWTSTRTPVR